jgi:hypothetical protein
MRLANVEWNSAPDTPGVDIIDDHAEVPYVGMAGRTGHGPQLNPELGHPG